MSLIFTCLLCLLEKYGCFLQALPVHTDFATTHRAQAEHAGQKMMTMYTNFM